MDKLDHRVLTLIKRAAEDAIHACNRHYGPFVDVVAHPLNIIALVEMAQSRQAELDQAYADIETFAQAHQRECDIKVQIANELKEKDKRIELLESTLKKINENLDLHDCESCWEHYFEIEKVIPEVQRGNNANS